MSGEQQMELDELKLIGRLNHELVWQAGELSKVRAERASLLMACKTAYDALYGNGLIPGYSEADVAKLNQAATDAFLAVSDAIRLASINGGSA